MRYRGRKVLVTGGTGFIGGRLVERLCLEEGADVCVLVRHWHKAVWVSRTTAHLVQGDVADPSAVREAMAGCDVVFHCVSGGNTREEYMRTNVDGTRNVLDAALGEGVERIVYLSSVAVHGPSPADHANEDAPFVETGKAYGESKIAAERLIARYWAEKAAPVCVLRPTFVWGPRSVLFTVQPLRSMKQGAFALVDGGAGSCTAVYVDNLVDAMLLAGTKPEAEGQAFLVTDGLEGVTWAEFFGHYMALLGIASVPSIDSSSCLVRLGSWAFEALGRVVVKLSPNPAPLWRRAIRRSARVAWSWLLARHMCSRWDLAKFARKGRLDITKARTLLGYSPRFSLDEAMAETMCWVKDQMGRDLGIAEPLADPFLPVTLRAKTKYE